MTEKSTPEDRRPSKPFMWLRELWEDPDALRPPRAIIPKLVWEGHVTLLAGREKGGKSTLAGAAAAAVSNGNAFFGEKTTKGKVLIIALEESRYLFSARLKKFTADPDHVAVLSQGMYEGDIIAAIHEAAEAIQPDLIIWDTLGAFADVLYGQPIDPGNSAQWTRVMRIVTDISREHGATLLLHHSRKSDGKYRDSTAIGGGVDMIVEMYGEGEDPRTLKGVGRFEFENVKVTFDGDKYGVMKTEEGLKKDILEFVKKHPRCSARDISDGIEGRATDVGKAKDDLLKDGMIANVGSGSKHEYMAVKK